MSADYSPFPSPTTVIPDEKLVDTLMERDVLRQFMEQLRNLCDECQNIVLTICGPDILEELQRQQLYGFTDPDVFFSVCYILALESLNALDAWVNIPRGQDTTSVKKLNGDEIIEVSITRQVGYTTNIITARIKDGGQYFEPRLKLWDSIGTGRPPLTSQNPQLGNSLPDTQVFSQEYSAFTSHNDSQAGGYILQRSSIVTVRGADDPQPPGIPYIQRGSLQQASRVSYDSIRERWGQHTPGSNRPDRGRQRNGSWEDGTTPKRSLRGLMPTTSSKIGSWEEPYITPTNSQQYHESGNMCDALDAPTPALPEGLVKSDLQSYIHSWYSSQGTPQGEFYDSPCE